MLTDYVENQQLKLLITLGIALVSVYVVKMFLNRFVTYYGHVIGVRMQADMRRDMFDRLLDLPVSFYDNNKTGSIMSRMISDLFDISELAHHGPEDILISGIMLVGSFIFMSRIYLPLTLIIFAFLPIMCYIISTKEI
jgi:ATP-binding cassette subfamily B protein